MKRFFVLILAFLTVFAVLPALGAEEDGFIAVGPDAPGPAYPLSGDPETVFLYPGGATDGFSYDPAKNELTLDSVRAPECRLSVGLMGEGFTVVLRGENELSRIAVYGGGRGCFIRFAGDGALTLNAEKTAAHAVELYPEDSPVKLEISSGPTLRFHGSEDAVFISDAASGKPCEVILADGSAAALEERSNGSVEPVLVSCCDLSAGVTEAERITYSADPDGVYAAKKLSVPLWGLEIGDLYEICRVVRSERRDVYLPDPSFAFEEGGVLGLVIVGADSLAERGFSFPDGGGTLTVPSSPAVTTVVLTDGEELFVADYTDISAGVRLRRFEPSVDVPRLYVMTDTVDPGTLGSLVPATVPSQGAFSDYAFGGTDLTVEGVPSAPVFDDVDPGAYYAPAVAWAASSGITRGTEKTKFSPDRPITRAETVTLLWRAQGCPDPAGRAPFEDVDSSAFYADAVAWAYGAGVTVGTGETSFSPDRPITRAEAATLLWRSRGRPEGSAEKCVFADVSVSDWFFPAVLWAQDGVTLGTDAAVFSPSSSCTRAQTVTFIYRAAEGGR